MDKNTIVTYLKEKKPSLEKEYGVTKIGLFGSYARGKSHKGSDIDIVVELRKPDLLTLVGIKQTVEDDLGADVDIVRNRKRMNQTLKKRIEQDAVYA